jgi:hypothetical protein
MAFLRRWLRGPGPVDPERSARGVLAGLLAGPPADLAALERLVGRLDIDMTGPEGRGVGVFRPTSPLGPGGPGDQAPIGELKPGVTRLFAGFDFDPYHSLPKAASALRPNQLSLGLDLDRTEVREALVATHGEPRTFDRQGNAVEEFGEWLYLDPWSRPTTVGWYRRRPDWALPAIDEGAPGAFLAGLAIALDRRTSAGDAARDVMALAAAAGATVNGTGDRLQVTARPGLPLTAVAAALGWSEPVAWSTDVHLSMWRVGQRDPATGGPARTRIGGWALEAWLTGWPRDAPATDTRGPSSVYDLRDHPGPVATLLATPVDAGPV